MRGASVTGSAMFNLGSVCNVYVFGRGSYFSGKTDYWQPLGRLDGQSNVKIWEGDFRLGKGFDIAPNFMLTPYLAAGCAAGIGTSARAAPASAAAIADSSHAYLGAGLFAQYAMTPNLVLSASGLVGSTFDSKLKGGPLANGNPTIVNFQTGLGNDVIYELEGSLDYAFTQNLHTEMSASNIPTSRMVSVSPFMTDINGTLGVEPLASRTENVTARAGLGWAFGAARS